ncbi:glycosyl transferase family 64 domain-containing protein [Circinella umbellata]|nr:glycosyl transferase family 64 domain-containing protein [Circinella umbellata]
MKPWNFHQYHDTDWLKKYHSSSFYQWRICKSWTLSSLENSFIPTTTLNEHDQTIIIRDRFSVLLSTYKPERINHLTLLIRHLLQSTLVHEIFITWHNPNLDVPTHLMEFIRNDTLTNNQDGERIHVLPQSYDSLNNRFNPVKQIQTEAVYILDDDVFMDIQDLEFTFSVWQQPNHKDSIVGHFPRIHQYDPETHEAIYKIANKDIYSMVLTKSMFVRTEYLFTFTCLMDLEIHHAIDSWMNCEDIAFNMMVSGMTGAPAIAVTPQNSLLDFGTKSGISTNLQHMGGRGECVSHFITNYWKEKDPLIVSSSAIVPYERPTIRKGSWNKIENQINQYQHTTDP